MPELPEVETVVRELNRALRGQKILAVKTSWPGPILQNTSARDIGQFLPDREAARRSYLESTSPMPRQRNGRNWPYPFGLRQFSRTAVLRLRRSSLTTPSLPRLADTRKLLATRTGRILENGSWIFSRSSGGFSRAKRELVGRTIQKVSRSGKRIFIYLSGDVIWVAHLKMTGAFFYLSQHTNILENVGMLWGKYVRAEFKLSRGSLYFSDIRKFGRMIVGKRETIIKHKDILGLAPDPFQISHSTLRDTLRRRSIPIKQALLDQKVIAGIGNIYADEILWASKIHPLLAARAVKENDTKKIIIHARRILKKSIQYGGTSMRDFKNTRGEKGGYLAFCNVYMRENKKCRRNCGETINRIVIGSRSARFCPKCQTK